MNTTRLQTRLSWLWRKIVRLFSGRWTTVPLPDYNETQLALGRRLWHNVAPFMTARQASNRALMTSVVVAYIVGGAIPHLEPRFTYGLAHPTHLKRWTPRRHVGKPVIMEKNGIKVGITEFKQWYMPRSEVLEAHRTRKAVAV